METEFKNLTFQHPTNNKVVLSYPNIRIVLGDITEIKADAIVNSANMIKAVGGGVDYAIHSKAGEGLIKEYAEVGGCKVGEAVITDGYKLPAEFVIHTVSPILRTVLDDPDEAKLELKKCYMSVLELAKDEKLETIAFPSIATGISGMPIEEGAEIAIATIKKTLDNQLIHAGKPKKPYIFKEIIFVLHSKNDYMTYLKWVKKIFVDNT